jgi:hypothetical protein
MIVGVDIDTWKLTLCALAPRGPVWETATLRRRQGERLLDAIQATQAELPLAVAALEERTGERPAEFYVERGRGQHRNADFDLGAIYGATIVALARACPGAHVSTMAVPEWKKLVTAAVGLATKRGEPGLGNVAKAVANDACRRLLRLDVLAPEALSADELDAFGIAYAARARVAA